MNSPEDTLSVILKPADPKLPLRTREAIEKFSLSHAASYLGSLRSTSPADKAAMKAKIAQKLARLREEYGMGVAKAGLSPEPQRRSFFEIKPGDLSLLSDFSLPGISIPDLTPKPSPVFNNDGTFKEPFSSLLAEYDRNRPAK